METKTQSVYAEIRTFCVKGFYQHGFEDWFTPKLKLEERKYTSENRLGALTQAKKDGLVNLASITDLTNKDFKLSKWNN